jgi:putative FmdB family regulatory protein
MPLYEYSCAACGFSFEAISSFARADQVPCEACGSPQVERLASVFASSIETSQTGPCGSERCAPSG